MLVTLKVQNLGALTRTDVAVQVQQVITLGTQLLTKLEQVLMEHTSMQSLLNWEMEISPPRSVLMRV